MKATLQEGGNYLPWDVQLYSQALGIHLQSPLRTRMSYSGTILSYPITTRVYCILYWLYIMYCSKKPQKTIAWTKNRVINEIWRPYFFYWNKWEEQFKYGICCPLAEIQYRLNMLSTNTLMHLSRKQKPYRTKTHPTQKATLHCWLRYIA